jgi:hypothetical protein
MLFVADVIPPELRRIIEFLNEQMDPAEVLGVEIKQYVGEGMKTLVPRVIGQTAEAEGKKGGTKGGRTFDKTKYEFEGQEFGKNRLVLAVIKKYVESKPTTTFSDLEKSFPKKLQGPQGCFDTAEKAQQKWDDSGRKRHFLNPEEVIALADSKIAVSTQWGIGNIGSFVEAANALGYSIEEVGE